MPLFKVHSPKEEIRCGDCVTSLNEHIQPSNSFSAEKQDCLRHRGVSVCVYLVVRRSQDAEYARVLFYAALAVNGKTRGVEMNFDL